MTQIQSVQQLKFRIRSLEEKLLQKQKSLEQYKSVQTQADKKIKASIQGLSKQHKRSKLIQQLNKQILDQDIVIDVLRKYIYQKQGSKQQGRQTCDKMIIDILKKGPDRIRPLTRQQLRMQIDKLKQINLMLQKKFKQGTKTRKNQGQVVNASNQDALSQVSQVMTQDSFLQNHQSSSQQILQKLRSLQLQTQSLKLESSSKNKIIQKFKIQIKQSQKIQSDFQLLKNQLQISNRKLFTYEKLLRDNKQTTNKKLIDLYQRQLKVQQLQLMSKQNDDKLKSLSENHNIFLQQLQLQKQQLQAKLQQLKLQNQKLIFENITKKKTFDEIKTINNQQKNHLGKQLEKYQEQTKRILSENQELKINIKNIQTKLFQQKAQWVQQRLKLIDQIDQLQKNRTNNQKIGNLMIQIDNLKEQNQKLKKMFGDGSNTGIGSGDDKLLLERLDNYKRKLEYYQAIVNKNPQLKTLQSQGYNQMFEKYNKLIQQFMEYKRKATIVNNAQKEGKPKKINRKAIVQLTKKQKNDYQNFSSGVDSLRLQDVDSEILDNFDSSYQFSIHVNQFGKQVKMPKISQADKQLLKLINSDLWYFVKDDKLTKKIDQASLIMDDQDNDYIRSQQLRKIKNLSHPRGQNVILYQNQLDKLNQMSQSVSITSAVGKQIEGYDSQINIQLKKTLIGATKNNNLNYKNFNNMSSDIGSDILVSSVQSGQSNLKKKKKATQKATGLRFLSKGSINSSDFASQIMSDDMLNSDVSSVNLGQRQLNRIDSDIQTDFRKKRK